MSTSCGKGKSDEYASGEGHLSILVFDKVRRTATRQSWIKWSSKQGVVRRCIVYRRKHSGAPTDSMVFSEARHCIAIDHRSRIQRRAPACLYIESGAQPKSAYHRRTATCTTNGTGSQQREHPHKRGSGKNQFARGPADKNSPLGSIESEDWNSNRADELGGLRSFWKSRAACFSSDKGIRKQTRGPKR